MAINIGDFVNEVLDEYSDEVLQAINETLKETADEAVSELKTAGDFDDRTGKYRKGWKTMAESGTLGVQNQVVHNGKHYRLTHLLEYGHVSRNGKRVRAFPHIAPVEAEIGDKVEARIKEKLG